MQDPPGFTGTREDVDRAWLGGLAVARWALLPAHLVTLVAARARWRRTTTAAATVSGVQLALGLGALGRGRPDPAVPGAIPVRLVTANLLLLNDDVEAVGRQLLSSGADLVCLQELVPRHLDPLRASGLWNELRHRVIDEQEDYHGSAVLSRWPLVGEVLQIAGHPVAAADISTPAGVVRVLSVHVVNPVSRTRGRRGRGARSWPSWRG